MCASVFSPLFPFLRLFIAQLGGDDPNGFAPSFVEKPRIIPNEAGTLITMKCRCKSKPAPVVTWYRGTDVVEESAKIAIKSSSTEEDIYELVLEIKDPSAPDGGTYRCHVKNEFGESNANLNLNIEAEPEPEGDGPIFLEKPRILSENNGKLVIMECKVKATPRPEITWTKEGKVLTETSQMKFSVTQFHEIYDIRLELSEPNLEDSGLYKCNIQNHLGELNANLTLNIESECRSFDASQFDCFKIILHKIFFADFSCAGHQGQTEDHQNNQEENGCHRMRCGQQVCTEGNMVQGEERSE